jgi:hypothetical protein
MRHLQLIRIDVYGRVEHPSDQMHEKTWSHTDVAAAAASATGKQRERFFKR